MLLRLQRLCVAPVLRSSLSTPQARRLAMKKTAKRSPEAAASPKTPAMERQAKRNKATEAMPSSTTPQDLAAVDVAVAARPPQPALSPPWTRESLERAARTLASLEPQRLAPLIEKHGVPYEKLLPKFTKKMMKEAKKKKKQTEDDVDGEEKEEEEEEESEDQNQKHHHHHHHHFATLARAIVGQQVSGAAASTIYSRVVTACLVEAERKQSKQQQQQQQQEAKPGRGEKQGFLPSATLTPESLLAVPPTALRAAGLSERKASYLVGLAERFLEPRSSSTSDSDSKPSSSSSSSSSSLPPPPSPSPSLSERLDALAEAGDSESMVAELVSVRGVGVWTAQMHVLFHAGGPDVLPTGDLGIKKGFAKLFGKKSGSGGSGGGGGGGGSGGGGKKSKSSSSSPSSSLPSEAQMLSWAEPFRPYRSLLSYYLWRAASE